MAKRQLKKAEHDIAVTAFRVVQEAVCESESPTDDEDSAAAKRGQARAAKLTPERRSEIARKAARARWDRRETGAP